ncbi:MAG: GNAT family N-acetyltransferase [Clostridiaceae bacterium]
MNLPKDVIIVPLTKTYLEQSINLVESTFDEEDMSLSKELEASVDEKKFAKYVKRYDKNMRTLEYFIAKDNNQRVIGIIGLYSLKKDYKDTYWIGWYCVDINERGKGIGKALLEFIITMAKYREKKYLCLYTSTDKNEAKAQKIYEQYGFFITKVIHKKGYEILYRKKIL